MPVPQGIVQVQQAQGISWGDPGQGEQQAAYFYNGGFIAEGLIDKGGQFFNVKAYNAQGNGTTDDAPAFTQAVTAAAAKGGAVVFVPAATYLLNSTVTVTSGVTVIVAAGVHFTGAGYLSMSGQAALVDLRRGLTQTGQFVPTQAVRDFSVNSSGASGSMPQKVFNTDAIDLYDIQANVDSRLNALQTGGMVNQYAWLLPYGPQGITPQSVMAVYDTTRPFKDPNSWQAIDLKVVTGVPMAEGFLGMCTLGGKAYLCPKQTKNQPGFVGTVKGNPNFFMYDSTKGRVDEPAAWSWFDGTQKGAIVDGRRGWVGCAHDGRYVYYAPCNDVSGTVHGLAVRYDSTMSFTDPTAWQTVLLSSIFDTTVGGYQGVVFTGKHMYYIQTQGLSTSDDVARFNIAGAFTSNGDGAWEHVHVATLSFSGASGYANPVGAMFVANRYLMTVPYGNNGSSTWTGKTAILDLDDPATSTLASSDNAWAIFDLTNVDARGQGYQYGWEAGDFVYLIPTYAGDGAPPPFIRWNKTRPFGLTSSWEAVTATTAPPWQTGGAYDGTYFYCAPLREFPLGNNVYSGRVYRVFSPNHPAGYSTQYLGRGAAFYRDVNNNIGISTNDPAYTLDVHGTIHSTQTINATLGSGVGTGKTVMDGDAAAPNVGNSAGSTTTLKSFTIPANTLSANGMYIEFWGEGTSAQNGDTNKNVTVSYGPVAGQQSIVATTFTNNAANATFTVRGTLMRSAAGAQEAGGELVNQAGTSGGYQRVTGAKDETADWILLFTGAGTTGSDVVLKSCGWYLHRGQT